MPHIIVEYPEQLVNYTQVGAMLQTIHHAIADSGLFKADQIRTRAYAFKKFTNAGGSEPYIHIQARINVKRGLTPFFLTEGIRRDALVPADRIARFCLTECHVGILRADSAGACDFFDFSVADAIHSGD